MWKKNSQNHYSSGKCRWNYSAIPLQRQENSTNCYWTKLESASPSSVKQIYWHHVVMKESTAFIARRPKRDQARTGSSCSKDPNSGMAFREGFLKTAWGRGWQGVWSAHAQFLWPLVGGEVTRLYFSSQHHQPSGSSWSGGLHAGGQHTVNFFCLLGVLVSAKQLKDMAQDIICSPWGEIKDPWLCFMAKLLLFCLAWLIVLFCFCIFSVL